VGVGEDNIISAFIFEDLLISKPRRREQSPVDIKNVLKASSALGPVLYKYGHSNATKNIMEYNGNNVEIRWTTQGEIYKGPFGPTRSFFLNIIYFHTPAEHLIAGKEGPLFLFSILKYAHN